MNKVLKKIVSLMLGAASVCTTALPIVGCREKGGVIYDPETKPLVFGTTALSGNFNPFFAPTEADAEIAAQTQIDLLTTNENGKLVCGADLPTAALDYRVTVAEDEETGALCSTYEFIIKKGIKFHNDAELTIDDVLFNLYVYLDPMYSGPVTVASADIQGLKAYRYQNELISDSADTSAIDGAYEGAARLRLDAVKEYLKASDPQKSQPTEQTASDIERIKALYKTELELAWTSCSTDLYEAEYNFTEKWQAYYFAEGLVRLQTQKNASGKEVAVRDENGKYLTDLDPDVQTGKSDPLYASEINGYANSEANITRMKEARNCTDAQAVEYLKEEFAVEKVYLANTGTDAALYDALTEREADIFADFVAQERSAALQASIGEDGLAVPNVSGVIAETATRMYPKEEGTLGVHLGEEYDVLKVVINGADAKSIEQFTFPITPANYYSASNEYENGRPLDHTQDEFGVSFGDKEFFDKVLQDPEKNGLPVGAGAYRASDRSGDGELTPEDFFENGRVYFERNEYFEAVGEELKNPYIKYVQYQVVDSKRLVEALEKEEIHVASPNATKEILSKVKALSSKLSYATYSAEGYGYVGLNAEAIPDIEVRQAIAKAMDTASSVTDYYTPELADTVYRSAIIAKWAYPELDGRPIGPYIPEDDAFSGAQHTESKQLIQDLVGSAGANGGNTWTLKNGVYTCTNGSADMIGKTLKFVFTVDCVNGDHPAYAMFQKAAKLLNECGFEITVKTDASETDTPQVWAGWRSGEALDLYDAFHKDTFITGVNEWGYARMYTDPFDSQFAYERTTVEEISSLIELINQSASGSVVVENSAKALDLIASLYVELPTYQRNTLVVYNKKLVNAETLNVLSGGEMGLFYRIWDVKYN